MFPAQNRECFPVCEDIRGQVFSVVKPNVSVSFLDASERTEYRQSFYTWGTHFENKGCLPVEESITPAAWWKTAAIRRTAESGVFHCRGPLSRWIYNGAKMKASLRIRHDIPVHIINTGTRACTTFIIGGFEFLFTCGVLSVWSIFLIQDKHLKHFLCDGKMFHPTAPLSLISQFWTFFRAYPTEVKCYREAWVNLSQHCRILRGRLLWELGRACLKTKDANAGR